VSARYRIAKQIERALSHPEIRAVFVDFDGNEGAILSLLPPELRGRVVFAKGAAMKARVEAELPPPRQSAPETEP